MQLNHYSVELVPHVIDLTNRPPRSAADLARRWLDAGMPLERPVVGADLAPVRDFLTRFAGLVDAPSEPERVRLLNLMLDEYATAPRITDHDDTGWHVHYRPDDVPHAAILRAAATVATAQHLVDNGMHRLGRCALEECDDAFVDLSRAGRQRYCSRACANRDAVRRHRANARR